MTENYVQSQSKGYLLHALSHPSPTILRSELSLPVFPYSSPPHVLTFLWTPLQFTPLPFFHFLKASWQNLTPAKLTLPTLGLHLWTTNDITGEKTITRLTVFTLSSWLLTSREPLVLSANDTSLQSTHPRWIIHPFSPSLTCSWRPCFVLHWKNTSNNTRISSPAHLPTCRDCAPASPSSLLLQWLNCPSF